MEGNGIQVPYLLSAQEIDDFIRSQPEEEPVQSGTGDYIGTLVLDVDGRPLDENETPAMPPVLSEIENGVSDTVMLDSTGHAVLYWMLVE